MPPDALTPSAIVVTSFLSDVERRLWIVDWLRAGRAAALSAAAGLAAAPALGQRSTSVWMAIALVSAIAAGVTVWRERARRTGSDAASLVEHGIPESRNVVFTARELLSGAQASAPWMRRRVVDAAAALVGRASAQSIVPVARDAGWLAAAAAVAVAVAVAVPSRVWYAARTSLASVTPAGAAIRPPPAGAADVTVTPPAYTGVAAAQRGEPRIRSR